MVDVIGMIENHVQGPPALKEMPLIKTESELLRYVLETIAEIEVEPSRKGIFEYEKAVRALVRVGIEAADEMRNEHP